jgi:hypothetical protein
MQPTTIDEPHPGGGELEIEIAELERQLAAAKARRKQVHQGKSTLSGSGSLIESFLPRSINNPSRPVTPVPSFSSNTIAFHLIC